MCTLTVNRRVDHLLVTMNRDESRSRAPELPPTFFDSDGVRWLGPQDSARGGTWIGANELGVVVCLLNEYQPEDTTFERTAERRSRGDIVPWLLCKGGADSMLDTLRTEFTPDGYPSFRVVIAHSRGVESFTWLGSGALTPEIHEQAWSVFTSSSWNMVDVKAWRARAFNEWREDGYPMIGLLPSIHLLQPDGLAEWSPLMDREKTATRSITQVEIVFDNPMLSMRYWQRETLDKDGVPMTTQLPVLASARAVHG